MKTIVYNRDFEELEIKPKAAIAQYRKLIAREVYTRLVESGELTPRACPGCHSEIGHPAFKKSGLTYIECARCKTVYVSPCPTADALTTFYRDSESARFWRGRLWEETREARRRKVYRPRADWTVDTLYRHHPNARTGIDVGYHSRLFLKEIVAEKGPLANIVVTNPIADVECAGLELDGVQVQPTAVAEIAQYGPADVVLAFDILPCIADVDTLFSAARASLTPGGLLLFNATSISGLDLQVLWDRSPNVYPPDRMNLLSVEGLTELSERHNFELLEFSTPGMFDVDIVQRAVRANPEDDWPRFIRYLIENRDKDALNALQEYLQKYRLSSFARLVLRRPRINCIRRRNSRARYPEC